VRELAILRLRDCHEMIATSLLYLQSKCDMASMNVCGSVVVRIDVFCCSVIKMEKNNPQQRYAIKF
jgi:hypothetical protein